MSTLEKIQTAEADLEELQRRLTQVHTGLEVAESVARGAERARSSRRVLVVVLVALAGIGIAVALRSRRRDAVVEPPPEPEAPDGS